MRLPRHVDYTEIAAGVLLLALGAFVVWESQSYPMGQMRNIGPGAFPTALGVILVIAGIGTVLGAIGRAGAAPVFKLRAAAAVALSLLVFAVLIEPFGLVPATLALTLIVRFAEPRPNLLHVLVLGVGLSVLCAAVFVYGLNLPIAIAKLP